MTTPRTLRKCETCAKALKQRPTESAVSWRKRRFCSKPCASKASGWNGSYKARAWA